MNRDLIMETLKILPQDFQMADFLEALYERVNAFKGIQDVENGNEKPLEEFMEELKNASINNI